MKPGNEKLIIKTFGVTDIQYKDKSIFVEDSFPSKIKLLFQYLIINRDKYCTKESIYTHLWSVKEPKSRTAVIPRAISKFRLILTKENAFNIDFSEYISIIYNNAKDGYQIQLSDNVETDTDILSHLIESTKNVYDYRELIDASEKLQSIYSGHFMDDCPVRQIAERLQNRYRKIYFKAIANILTKLSKLLKYTDVIGICENHLKKFELDDTINHIFLQALMTTGQENYALMYCDTLKTKMGNTASFRRIKSMVNENDEDTEALPAEANTADEAVPEQNHSEISTYSILKIEFTSGTKIENSANILKKVIYKSLRREATYVILDEYTAIAMLSKNTEKSHKAVKRRIQKYLYEICDKKHIELNEVNIVISLAFVIL
jgi:DNA-binding SARP family transcriptional activator